MGMAVIHFITSDRTMKTGLYLTVFITKIMILVRIKTIMIFNFSILNRKRKSIKARIRIIPSLGTKVHQRMSFNSMLHHCRRFLLSLFECEFHLRSHIRFFDLKALCSDTLAIRKHIQQNVYAQLAFVKMKQPVPRISRRNAFSPGGDK